MLQPVTTSAPGIDRDKLATVVEPLARAHGAEVVDCEWKREAGGWVLRVYVEKLGSAEKRLSTQDASVDLGLCADVARDLSPALDVADFIPHRYSLEVSTPGVERALRGERDYVRFEGKKAKLKLLRAAPGGQKVLIGLLGPVTGESVRVVECGAGARAHDVPMADVASAHLVFEFGPSPKPGKKK